MIPRTTNPIVTKTKEPNKESVNLWSLSDYLTAKSRAEPYNKIVGQLPEMRRETVELVRKSLAENRRAYVLVNNRSEGNAPLTIQALNDQLKEARADGAQGEGPAD